MSTNFQQSKDVLHPLAFDFTNKCRSIGVTLEPNEINAIDFLTRQLVQNNLWEKFKAIYPFVGKFAKTHSLNLKNTERHYIVWYNESSLKHDSNGVTNVGIGYGNTMVAPSWFNDNDIHVSVYNTTRWNQTNSTAPIIGTRPREDSLGWMHSITLRSRDVDFVDIKEPTFTYSCGSSSSSTVRFAGSDASQFQHIETLGLIVGVNGIKCYVNGEIYGRQGNLSDKSKEPINEVTKRTVDGNTAEIPNISQYPFLLFTNGRFTSTTGLANANIRFASIGYQLNDQENDNLYKIVQEFQTILGRSVEPIKLKTFEAFLEDYLTLNMSINKILILPTRPYREYLNITTSPKEFPKINALSASVNISKVEVFGPVRIFLSDSAATSVSIQSLIEL